MKLQDYLDRIARGEALNYEAFLKCLPQEVRARHRRVFRTTRVGGRWKVEVPDAGDWERLLAVARRPASRAEAARQGDSHRHDTAVSYLLVHHQGLEDERPAVVYLAPGICRQGFQRQRRALVIENEENFFRPQAMLELASRFRDEVLDPAGTDVVLGGGNRVLRPLVREWLAGYEQVLCAFDCDPGGLAMYAGLREHAGPAVEFLQPADWRPWHPCFRRSPDSTAALAGAIRRAQDLELDGLAAAFSATRRFMEQEMLL